MDIDEGSIQDNSAVIYVKDRSNMVIINNPLSRKKIARIPCSDIEYSYYHTIFIPSECYDIYYEYVKNIINIIDIDISEVNIKNIIYKKIQYYFKGNLDSTINKIDLIDNVIDFLNKTYILSDSGEIVDNSKFKVGDIVILSGDNLDNYQEYIIFEKNYDPRLNILSYSLLSYNHDLFINNVDILYVSEKDIKKSRNQIINEIIK